jgi:hypothetical protein
MWRAAGLGASDGECVVSCTGLRLFTGPRLAFDQSSLRDGLYFADGRRAVARVITSDVGVFVRCFRYGDCLFGSGRRSMLDLSGVLGGRGIGAYPLGALG